MRIRNIVIGLLLIGKAQAQTAGMPSAQPVFQVDYAYPTADKPQSKLWYDASGWWALLPRSNGPSLWQRTPAGWKEHTEVSRALRGTPGRADVWVDKDGVTAVGVSKDSLVVFHLEASTPGGEWRSRVLTTLKPPAKEDIETATVARDSKGDWWVAADGDVAVYAWHSADGNSWSPAILLRKGISKDDICAVAAIPGAVMVCWSNQQEEAVQYRLHRDGHPASDWEKEGVVQAGNKTADDHLHTARGPDGTIWMVTKNSVDSNNYPQLVLRVRHASGGWSNFAYAPRTAEAEPSRPVIMATPDAGLFLAGHSIYDKTDRYKERIEFGRIDTAAANILVNRQVVIMPAAELHARVNDCTVSKAPFPAGAPWIILASDEKGRVYEADLSRLFP